MKNKYVRLLVMSLVIILAVILVQDFGDFLDENSNSIIKLGVNQHCNSATSICSASVINEGEFQRISFAIKEASASDGKSAATISVVGFDFVGVESISAAFEMPGNDLDDNRVLFKPDKSTHQVVAENWTAMISLPIVSKLESSKLRTGWLAVIRLKSSEKEYRAEFPFHF